MNKKKASPNRAAALGAVQTLDVWSFLRRGKEGEGAACMTFSSEHLTGRAVPIARRSFFSCRFGRENERLIFM